MQTKTVAANNTNQTLACRFLDDAISICWNRLYDYNTDDDVYANYVAFVTQDLDCTTPTTPDTGDGTDSDGLQYGLQFSL